MKEIGGYFGLEEFVNNEYYKDLIALNSGRNALLYLIKIKSIRKIYIPHYICEVIVETLTKSNIEFEYYNIDNSFNAIFEKNLLKDEYIYIINYFGCLNNEEISNLKNKFTNVIIDNAHAFFQRPVSGVDTLYTCRKFFGVPDGAYLYTDSKSNLDIEMDVSLDRMKHVLGRYEGKASDYFNDFVDSDNKLTYEPIKKMSKITHNILGAIDYERCRKIRNENYMRLHEELGIYNKLNVDVPYGAFSYPLYVEDASYIKKELILRRIYVPTLWPNVVENMEYDTIEYMYSNNIIPLPCDQRYNLNDMDTIITNVKEIIIKCKNV